MMAVLTWIYLACLLGLVQSATHRRTSCIRCHNALSLKHCTTMYCSSGPTYEGRSAMIAPDSVNSDEPYTRRRIRHECYMHITEHTPGKRIYNAGCTSSSECVNLAWNPRTHSSSDVCRACCVDKSLCVPHLCQQQLTEKIPEFRLEHGVQCEVCTGGTCGVFPGQDPVLQCPDELPYCMNIVKNEADGNKQFTKLCASESDCDTFWWDKTRKRPECMNFDPSSIYTSALECSYCCLTSQCNRSILPANDTLYIGAEVQTTVQN